MNNLIEPVKLFVNSEVPKLTSSGLVVRGMENDFWVPIKVEFRMRTWTDQSVSSLSLLTFTSLLTFYMFIPVIYISGHWVCRRIYLFRPDEVEQVMSVFFFGSSWVNIRGTDRSSTGSCKSINQSLGLS